jgi:methylthioribose-1-phosphate isomerase
MLIGGKPSRSLWIEADGWSVGIIDQTKLPHTVETLRLATAADAARAIATMQARGAPLIGAVGAYGLCLALHADPSDRALENAYRQLAATRPTAVNLKWGLDQIVAVARNQPHTERARCAYARAASICEEDVAANEAIGRHGLALIERAAARKSGSDPVNVLTHCNAGWLATVDWGTATAPLYLAHRKGVPLHVWVDETRPRNQGSSLTAFELQHQGVPYTVIADNAGGHLMQCGLVDLVITGADRVTAAGDVCNKIGTYLKALAARDTGVPVYAALPSTTIDFALGKASEIPIEQREGGEVATVTGRARDGRIETVTIVPEGAAVANYAFDVTPARLVSGLITERGIIAANREALAAAFTDRQADAQAKQSDTYSRAAGSRPLAR